MHKKITYILIFIFLTSCADTLDSVKRGLTGGKKSSADEFLVKKKDPLILPPDFENLPSPGEEELVLDENLIFEEALTEEEDKENSSSSKSVESSILKKIKRK